MSAKDPVGEFSKFFEMILPNPKKRFRIAGRAINDVSSKKAMDVEMQIERLTHANFDQYNGILLCYYEHKKMNGKTEISDIKNLIQCHHGTMFSTVAKPGFAFWNH
ncbi:MAG: hypothetical protein ACKOCQ_03815 [Candidatus Nitrosotenuis sp.]